MMQGKNGTSPMASPDASTDLPLASRCPLRGCYSVTDFFIAIFENFLKKDKQYRNQNFYLYYLLFKFTEKFFY